MNEYIEKSCPKCRQRLRFPTGIGGMVMACPSCGKKFYSDFRLQTAGSSRPRSGVAAIFEMPAELVGRLRRNLFG